MVGEWVWHKVPPAVLHAVRRVSMPLSAGMLAATQTPQVQLLEHALMACK